MRKVIKKFKTVAAMNKFISENSLNNPNVSFGGLQIEHYVDDEAKEDTEGCVGCKTPETKPAQKK